MTATIGIRMVNFQEMCVSIIASCLIEGMDGGFADDGREIVEEFVQRLSSF